MVRVNFLHTMALARQKRKMRREMAKHGISSRQCKDMRCIFVALVRMRIHNITAAWLVFQHAVWYNTGIKYAFDLRTGWCGCSKGKRKWQRPEKRPHGGLYGKIREAGENRPLFALQSFGDLVERVADAEHG